MFGVAVEFWSGVSEVPDLLAGVLLAVSCICRTEARCTQTDLFITVMGQFGSPRLCHIRMLPPFGKPRFVPFV